MLARARWLIDAVVVGLLAVIFNKVWGNFAYKLGENAVLGWLDSVIGTAIGLKEPSPSEVATFIWNWGVPFAAAVVVLLGYHWFQARTTRAPRASGRFHARSHISRHARAGDAKTQPN